MTQSPEPLPLVPREVLFGNPDKVQPRISPDGLRLAYIAPHLGVLNVFVGEIGADPDGFEPVTADTDRGIRAFFWAHDNQHILYTRDKGGDENWRLYDVDVDTKAERDLTPFDKVQAQIIAHEQEFPTEVLVGLNRDNPQLHDVYHLDLETGELKKLVENPGVIGWVADTELKVRAAMHPRDDGGMDVLARRPNASLDEWEMVVAVDAEDALGTGPVAFTADGTRLYMLSSVQANATRLLRVDLTGQHAEVLAEDPNYDVSGVVLHPDSRELQIVSFTKARAEHHRRRPHDPGRHRRHPCSGRRRLGHPGPGPRRCDLARVAQRRRRAGGLPRLAPGQAGGDLPVPPPARPTDYQLAQMEPFRFVARDGTEVHGYLTFPPGLDQAGLPMVLNVHGGPWARDVWGYNPEAQWLANRGYLCAQINFRGSTGYGKSFLNKGNREWARPCTTTSWTR